MTVTSAARGDGTAQVTVAGCLDAADAPVLWTELERLFGLGVFNLVVDLTAVDFVDSAGLAVLVKARRQVSGLGGAVFLLRPATDDAMRVFQLTQFDKVFVMVSTRPAP